MSSVPTLTISTANPVILNDDIIVSGTIDPADAGEQIGVYDGLTLLKTVTAAADGTWSTSLALPEATTYSLTAQATNATGTGTSAAITLDAFTFSQADLSVATTLASDINQAAPSDIETVSTAGPTTISSSATYVIDTAATSNTIDSSSQDIITGDGGTTINLSGLSTSASSGPNVLIALASGAATIPGTSYSNIVNINETVTAVVDGDASTLVVNGLGQSTIALVGSGGAVETANEGTIAGDSGIYNIVNTGEGSGSSVSVTASSAGTYNIEDGQGASTAFGDAGSYFAASGDASQSQATFVAGGGAETFNAANASDASFYGGPGSADFIGGSDFNNFAAGSGDEVMVAGNGYNIFSFTAGNGGGDGYFTGSTYTIEDFSSADSLQFSGNSYNVGAYALEYQKVVNGDLVLPLGDGAEIIFEGRTTLLSSSQVEDSDKNGTAPTAPTIAAPPTPLSVTGAAVAAIDGNSGHTSGTVTTGDTVTLALTFSAIAYITGNPTLQLNDGGVATYVSGSGGTKVTFTYTPSSGQNVSTLASTGLVNGAIQDAYGNPATGVAQTFTGLSVDTEPPCYCRGARIATPDGEVAIETLRIGDLLLTASGEARPIQWIGHRTLDLRRRANPQKLWPICVSAGAFGENRPSRDLWLSPGHSVAIEGVLIPIGSLQNGKSVTQRPVASVEYWHVELDRHDIILAEGLAAESYLDNGNRTGFVNGGPFIEAHPEFQPKHWTETCLPLVLQGPPIARAKAALLGRLEAEGRKVTSESDIHVKADGERIEPMKLSADRLAFTLPPGRQDIRLISRSFIPAHTQAENNDPRTLGVCVRRLQIDGEDVDLGDESHFRWGWNGLEPGQRWTRGDAPLASNTRLVVIDLNGRGSYWDEDLENVISLLGRRPESY